MVRGLVTRWSEWQTRTHRLESTAGPLLIVGTRQISQCSLSDASLVVLTPAFHGTTFTLPTVTAHGAGLQE